MKRTIKKNKKLGRIEIVYDGDIDEYIELDRYEDGSDPYI